METLGPINLANYNRKASLYMYLAYIFITDVHIIMMVMYCPHAAVHKTSSESNYLTSSFLSCQVPPTHSTHKCYSLHSPLSSHTTHPISCPPSEVTEVTVLPQKQRNLKS